MTEQSMCSNKEVWQAREGTQNLGRSCSPDSLGDCRNMQQLLALCAAICLGLAAAQSPASGPAQVPNTAFSANNAPVVGPGGWREGRATFYDAPTYFQEAFASRGAGAFGSILYGDCSYSSRAEQQTGLTSADQAYNKDMVAALSSADLDYPGSCGRCYEIQ